MDPERLGTDASLNQLLVDGRSGSELLSAEALDADRADDAELGRRIAALLRTLRDPRTAVEQGATPERRAYLEHWRTIDEVHLGGGRLVGRDVRVPGAHVAAHPQSLALVGAARSLPPDDGDFLVVDGGHTTVKRAVASVRRGKLAGLELLTPLATGSAPVHELLTAALDDRPHDRVVVSVAAYVADGRVADKRGAYEHLDVGTLGRASGARIHLLHDGTAAWRGTGATGPSAVIVLGTFLGVGLGPHRSPLLPYAPGFSLV